MPFLKITPRLTLHYLERNFGAQKAVVLLHGLGVTAESWQLQAPALAKAGFRVIIPDAPGFGRSTYPGGSMSIRDISVGLASLIKNLTNEPVHLAGISMGGTLALQIALDHPELVDRLMLVNTFARLNLSSPSSWFYFVSRFAMVHVLGLPTQARFVARRLFPEPDQEGLRREMVAQVIQANPAGYRSAMRALARFDVLNRLAELRCPTLIITAENDTTVQPENQAPLVEQIPGARQVIIPNAGHAVIVEQPQEFNDALLGFILQRNPEEISI